MQYPTLGYISETEDPSLRIETRDIVANVIDNTGLSIPENPDRKPYFGRYGLTGFLPFSHHLGYHGLRTIYDRAERRNLVAPFVSWMNLQFVKIDGVQLDPVDERASYGIGRGWPMRMEPCGKGAALIIDRLPVSGLSYRIEFQPSEPDAIDFTVQFQLDGPTGKERRRFEASWPCYTNSWNDVRLWYPRGKSLDDCEWIALGERPDLVLGETVGYVHRQQAFLADEPAAPIGFGSLGGGILAILLDDPHTRLFIVNAGGHMSFSSVQNPAWDISYVLWDYPLNEPFGFHGRLIYSKFENPRTQVIERYHQWIAAPRK